MSKTLGNGGEPNYLIVRSCRGFTCWVDGKPRSPAFLSRKAAAVWAERNAKRDWQEADSARVCRFD